jgi:hypothetical protein
MSLSAPSARAAISDEPETVQAELTYLAPDERSPQIRVYPPSSGLATVRPASARYAVLVRDARPIADRLSLDEQGFALHSRRSAFADYYDEAAVRRSYYPEVEHLVQELTGALAVIVFDHNVRSAARAARGETGVREPVDQAHNDYTEKSGPKRKQEILAAAGRADLASRDVAFVNLWRPIVGPVVDNPLAVCDARSVATEDFVATEIQHFGEDNLSVPRHSGQIYSLHYSASHRWFYVSRMCPEEVLLLKCYDSRMDGRARFMPHTGFHNPACPPGFVPRESIEARTLVVFE